MVGTIVVMALLFVFGIVKTVLSLTMGTVRFGFNLLVKPILSLLIILLLLFCVIF